MPTNIYLRDRLVRLVRSDGRPVARRDLIRRCGMSYQKQADEQIGLLLSDGVLITIGSGHRGNPVRLIAGPNWPALICPTCKQKISEY